MTALVLSHLHLERAGRALLNDISLTLAPGQFIGLIGPNGAGKTTLLRGTLGLLPCEGQSSLAALPPKARATRAAFLPQAREVAWPLAVRDLVALGRLPWGGAEGPQARQAVDKALAQLGLTALAARPYPTLSGGEKARVLLARVLAQETPFLLADEPIASLDPAQQIRTLAVLKALAGGGRGILAALHELPLAARFCTHLAAMHEGRLVAFGAPKAVLTPKLLAEVFGLRPPRAEDPEAFDFTGWEALA